MRTVNENTLMSNEKRKHGIVSGVKKKKRLKKDQRRCGDRERDDVDYSSRYRRVLVNELNIPDNLNLSFFF